MSSRISTDPMAIVALVYPLIAGLSLREFFFGLISPYQYLIIGSAIFLREVWFSCYLESLLLMDMKPKAFILPYLAKLSFYDLFLIGDL